MQGAFGPFDARDPTKLVRASVLTCMGSTNPNNKNTLQMLRNILGRYRPEPAASIHRPEPAAASIQPGTPALNDPDMFITHFGDTLPPAAARTAATPSATSFATATRAAATPSAVSQVVEHFGEKYVFSHLHQAITKGYNRKTNRILIGFELGGHTAPTPEQESDEFFVCTPTSRTTV